MVTHKRKTDRVGRDGRKTSRTADSSCCPSHHVHPARPGQPARPSGLAVAMQGCFLTGQGRGRLMFIRDRKCG